ncbi:MAG: ATP-binding cassette domain-containing protein [Fuerstiella sp.]
MPDSLWNLENVSLAGDSLVGNSRNRLHEISLHIPAGVTAIVGYSGAGKTSLLNVLAGMETPSSGKVESRHSDTRLSAAEFSLPLFWAPQDGGLWPHLTAIQHLNAMPGCQTELNAANSRKSADNWLQLFDLEHRQNAVPRELSKGEQARLSIARALAANSAVLLMDEPLTHVDPARKPKYWSLIREHIMASNSSLVFCTHETAVVIRESQFVICLENGQVIHTGTSQQLYDNPPNVNVAQFLGPINWFDREASSIWLADQISQQTDFGLRPERTLLIPDENGALRILSFHFSGSYAETKLEHIPSSSEKTFVHRPSGNVHQPGQLVRIQVLS